MCLNIRAHSLAGSFGMLFLFVLDSSYLLSFFSGLSRLFALFDPFISLTEKTLLLSMGIELGMTQMKSRYIEAVAKSTFCFVRSLYIFN